MIAPFIIYFVEWYKMINSKKSCEQRIGKKGQEVK